MFIEHEIILLYNWFYFNLGTRPLPSYLHSHFHFRPHSCPYFHIDGTHFAHNHSSDMDRVDEAHFTNDTMNHLTVQQGTLCNGHYRQETPSATIADY